MAVKKPAVSTSLRTAREKLLLEVTSLPTAAGRDDREDQEWGGVPAK